MKKQLLIAIAGLFSVVASAADLYVRENDANAFSTVSAAIAQASNGDRIIIRPKTNGSAYVENLTINKSLTFVSETPYNRYFIRGTVTISPAPGRIVTISGLSSGDFSIYNVVSGGATTGGRTTINLMNCYLNNVSTSDTNTTTNISGCTVRGTLNFSHGRCTANKAQYITAYSTTTDTSLATSDVEIFGNVSDFGLTNSQQNYNFRFYNNFVTAMNIYAIKTGSSNEIVNNTVYNPNPGDMAPFYINLPNGNTGNIAIMNNAVSFAVGQTSACIQNNNNATVTATYNLFTNTFLTDGAIIQSNNSGTVNMNFDNVAYTVSGMNVNAGNPAVSYTDLDLTRNDVGHYGGSNSWANYWPADNGGRPQVNYLVTPRSIGSGTINISGSGFSR